MVTHHCFFYGDDDVLFGATQGIEVQIFLLDFGAQNLIYLKNLKP